MSQTIALKLVDASLATAMSYLSVVWGIVSGYLVFGEVSGSVTTCVAKHVWLVHQYNLFQEAR